MGELPCPMGEAQVPVLQGESGLPVVLPRPTGPLQSLAFVVHSRMKLPAFFPSAARIRS